MINERKLDRMLTVCGLPDNLRGTEQLRVAVRLYTPGMMVTKELYPAVAAAVGSTTVRVERSMRTALESGFNRCGYDVDVIEIFGNTIDPDKGKPTVSEFVARAARLCRAD